MRAQPPSITNQVIVITGASSGFGKGAALGFAGRGASLVLAARRGELLEALARECEAMGGKAIAVPTDVSRCEEVERLGARALERFGRIDTWINDAGTGVIGRFAEVPLKDHIQVINTNLLGTLCGSHFALRHFEAHGSGVLINVASMLGDIPAPFQAAYNASKSAVISLGRTLRLELGESGRDNIHICTVLPMAMDTPFFEHAGNYTGKEAAPIPPTYDANMVVDTLVRLAERPEPETIVGGAGKIASFFHRVAPELVESISAKITAKAQISDAEPAGITQGAVHVPVPQGTGVHGKSGKP